MGSVRFMAMALVLFAVAVQHAGVSYATAGADGITGNTAIQSFSRAKKLMRQVFAGHERTFYCDCAYSGNTVDLESCDYL